MATCQAVNAVLPPTVHERVLFFYCPHLHGKNKVEVNLEPPM
jgi:hypothetical protein